MVGQGVLRECLLDPEVQVVQTVGRTPTGLKHPKLREIVRSDLLDYTEIESALRGFDACFFCLGVSSTGMSESEYERVTYAVTMAAAQTLSRLNPGMTFIYVSGAGTDSSEKGRVMWARVKGKTENALLRLPFKAAYMFRPGAIQPVYGRALQDSRLSRRLRSRQTGAVPAPPSFSPPHLDHRRARSRNAPGSKVRRSQDNSREFRHQRLPESRAPPH